jgi:hypothetical protein
MTLQWPTVVPLQALVVAGGVLGCGRDVLDYYPAHKASNLDPIDALWRRALSCAANEPPAAGFIAGSSYRHLPVCG